MNCALASHNEAMPNLNLIRLSWNQSSLLTRLGISFFTIIKVLGRRGNEQKIGRDLAHF